MTKTEYVNKYLQQRLLSHKTYDQILAQVHPQTINKAYRFIQQEQTADASQVDNLYVLAQYERHNRCKDGIPDDDTMWAFYAPDAELLETTIEEVIKSKNCQPSIILSYSGKDPLTLAYAYDHKLYKPEANYVPINNYNVSTSLREMLCTIRAYTDNPRSYIEQATPNITNIQGAYDTISAQFKDDENFCRLTQYYIHTLHPLTPFDWISTSDAIILLTYMLGTVNAGHAMECFKVRTVQACLYHIHTKPNAKQQLEEYINNRHTAVLQMKSAYLSAILQQNNLTFQDLDRVKVNYQSVNNIDVAFYKFCKLGIKNNTDNIELISPLTQQQCFSKVQTTLIKINVKTTEQIIQAFADCVPNNLFPSDAHSALYVLTSYRKACNLLHSGGTYDLR